MLLESVILGEGRNAKIVELHSGKCAGVTVVDSDSFNRVDDMVVRIGAYERDGGSGYCFADLSVFGSKTALRMQNIKEFYSPRSLCYEDLKDEELKFVLLDSTFIALGSPTEDRIVVICDDLPDFCTFDELVKYIKENPSSE